METRNAPMFGRNSPRNANTPNMRAGCTPISQSDTPIDTPVITPLMATPRAHAIFCRRFDANPNALPGSWRTSHQLLALSGQRWNRKEDDSAGHGEQREHQQEHTDKTRNVMFLQPDHDRVQNHGKKEDQREDQNY